MKTTILALAVVLAAAFALAGSGEPALAHPTADQNLSLSAAKKKPVRRRAAPPEHIACTILGCQPTPPGCHPEMGYYPDGTPTGFDVMACPR